MLRLPKGRCCGLVDGFSAAVVVCRASLRGASMGVRVCGAALLESYYASCALVTRYKSATTFVICAREHGRIQPETLRCRGQPFLQS